MSDKAEQQLRLSPPRVGRRLWFKWHLQGCLAALGRMTRAPIASLMTLSVIAIALALPGAMVVALDNFAKLGGQFDGAKRLSVFFIGDIDQLRVRKVGAELQTRTEVATLREVSPNAAIEEFAAMGGSRTALDNLAGQNPFPWMLELELKREYADPEQIQSLVAELKQYPAISEVIYDRVWLERLFALMSLGRYVAMIVASRLGFGVVLVVGNTIRLEIGARRDELEILALFGGTNAFIRRPFLWTGAWYGAAGGMMATVILLVEVALLSAPVADLSAAYASTYQLQGVRWELMASLTVGGMCLGLLGAWGSVSRYLSVSRSGLS